jgi:hypothetical protein
MPMIRYRYELRHRDATLATGHLTREEQLRIGDRLEIAGSSGIVHSIEPVLGEHELRLVVELLRSRQTWPDPRTKAQPQPQLPRAPSPCAPHAAPPQVHGR